MPQSNHLIENAAQAPNVALLVVGFLLADLGREVVWRANSCLRAVVGVLEDSGNAEITDLDLVRLGHEDVLGLEIAVKNLPVMNVLDGKAHLHKPVKNLVLAVHHYRNQTNYKSLPLPIFFWLAILV